MAKGSGRRSGGILGLADVLADDEYRSALEADLLRDGYRLRWFLRGGDPDHTLADLISYVRNPLENSSFYRVISGDDWIWGLPEQLLAGAVDQLTTLVWMKTKDGSKNINRPKPIPRPGVRNDIDSETIKGTAAPVDVVADKLGIDIFRG